MATMNTVGGMDLPYCGGAEPAKRVAPVFMLLAAVEPVYLGLSPGIDADVVKYATLVYE